MPQRIRCFFIILWSFLLKSIRRDLVVFISILLLLAAYPQRYVLMVYAQASLWLDQSAIGSPIAQAMEGVRLLEPGKPIKREIAGGQAQHYQIMLLSHQFLQVVVNQLDIDVVVIVFGPDDKKILEADSLFDSEGPERFSIVNEIAGTYRVEVRPLEKDALTGHYWIKVDELRPAIPQDQTRIEAERIFQKATSLIDPASKGTLQKVVAKYESAFALFQSLNDQTGEARTLYSISVIYRYLSEQQKELDYLQRARPFWEATGDSLLIGNTLRRIGVIYSITGEMLKSIDNFALEAHYWETLGELLKQAGALNNMAIVYYSIGDNPNALKYYSKAFQIVQAANDAQGQGAALSNMGRVYDDSGEKQKALEAYNKSIEFSKLAKDPRTQSRTLRHLGSLYFSLGEPQKALDKFKEALAMQDGNKDNLGKALSLNKIGMVHNFYGETNTALGYYEQALALIRSLPAARGEGYILTNIGGIYFSQGEYQKGFDYYKQAILRFQSSVDPLGEAQALNNIGQAYINRRDEQEALEHLSKALSINRAINCKSGEAYSHYLIAQAKRNVGNLDESLANIDEALETVEALRAKIDADDLRESYFGSVQDYYNFKIDLLMQLDKLAPSKRYAALAFQTNERARARTLMEILVEAGVDIREGVDPVLLQRQQALQQSLNALASGRQLRLLKGKQTPDQAASVAREIEKLTISYQELKAQIRTRSPRYAALTQPQPLSLANIQERVLDDDTLLLEYSLGQERSYLWAVTKRSIDSFTLPGRSEIEAATRRLYSLLTDRNKQEIKFETVEERRERIKLSDSKIYEAATVLGRMVLQPVAAQLTNKRLLIVADGALQYIPFAILTTVSESSAKPVYIPLIAEHEMVSLPSASTLAVLRQELNGRKPAPKALAVLADPIFSNNDERLKNKKASYLPAQMQDKKTILEGDQDRASDSGFGDVRLDRLRHTRQEAEAILALLAPSECKSALDFDASRATATSAELSEYRFIHFATHGFLDDLHPELSGIVLSLVNGEGVEQNGFLRAIDIFNLKLPAELVVLSGCQTGLGKQIRGEGIVGLTRAFMYAGAARMLVSLWDVNDKATAELMERFYNNMLGKPRLQPAAALRAAQLSMWREKGLSPYYWAAFVLNGELRALSR
jgi:CHAT domain-containing protein/tetratricopeptide (TPR) repeat protein